MVQGFDHGFQGFHGCPERSWKTVIFGKTAFRALPQMMQRYIPNDPKELFARRTRRKTQKRKRSSSPFLRHSACSAGLNIIALLLPMRLSSSCWPAARTRFWESVRSSRAGPLRSLLQDWCYTSCERDQEQFRGTRFRQTRRAECARIVCEARPCQGCSFAPLNS